ncbi:MULTISPECIES: VanZ family protein [Bacillus]|uniref:VanZ family protein n=1 Tax=Bacillus paramycoides TaxID=2026194 RepID=A0ABU6N029_9BACI|nr:MULTISPECIES: VanZ family protein [Bacillus]MED1412658.1 VanZ family protein [Bacillus paramycoides]MED1466625.1 VanZ family protein [Bacillus paramycoides]MED1495886.1 VanZ family protein [Bacillus paramycoides]MED1568466.1 VanZ family protein [Bacillus paramycoides]
MILYFMFLGFDRLGLKYINHEYEFQLIPSSIPLSLPNMVDREDFNLWFFNFGNLTAFIPFGVLIPMLYRCSFIRFITSFCISILILEVLQMVTFLGGFDIDDVIVNAMGATIGFCAYKIGFRSNNTLKNFIITGVTAFILTLGVLVVVGEINKSLEKEQQSPKNGTVIALNQLTESTGYVPKVNNSTSFEVAHKKIEPKLNMFSSKGTNSQQFKYLLKGKYAKLSGYLGIPDSASKHSGKIIISIDGKDVQTLRFSEESISTSTSSFRIELAKANELSIKFIDTDALLWDVKLTEWKK